jgi:hypothetical protein
MRIGIRVVSASIKDEGFLDGERAVIDHINREKNTNFKCMDEIYDAGIINITIDPHRSLLAMPEIARGFSLVVSTIQFHFIKNCTPVDFYCSDNPVVYFPAGQQPNRCQPYSKFCKTALWSVFPADKPAPQPPPGTGTGYHLVMQTDGNLCLYRQTPGAAVWINPETARNLAKDGRSLRLADSGTAGIDGIWGSGPSDGFGDVEFEKVEYLTDQAKIASLGPPKANVSAVAENYLDEEQNLSVALAYSKSISSSWKVSTSLKIGTKRVSNAGFHHSPKEKSKFLLSSLWALNGTKPKRKPSKLPIRRLYGRRRKKR